MDTARDEVQEELLGDIIARGSDAVVSSFLNDTDGLEAASYDYDGSGDLMPVQEGDREDGFGDPMPVQEGDRDDGSGDRTESGQVYILVKPMLTSLLMHSLFWYVHILIKSLFFFLSLRIEHNFGKETRPEEKVELG